MKIKGFTLIELLAVIVILAIIALIATPIVMNTIEKSKIGAAKESATNYAKAIETATAQAIIDENTIADGIYDIKQNGQLCIGIVDEDGNCLTNPGQVGLLDIEVNGTKPTAGKITILNGEVAYGSSLVINEYNYVYDGTEFLKSADKSCFADGFIDEGLHYIGYYNSNKCGTDLVVPSIIEGNAVHLNNESLGDNITNLVLPNTIDYLWFPMFFNSKISKLVLPYGFKVIGFNGTFSGFSELELVDIPSTVTSIGEVSMSSDPKLIKIINRTGKSFDWGKILYYDINDDGSTPTNCRFVIGDCTIPALDSNSNPIMVNGVQKTQTIHIVSE